MANKDIEFQETKKILGNLGVKFDQIIYVHIMFNECNLVKKYNAGELNCKFYV
jgi:hypothetical protein